MRRNDIPHASRAMYARILVPLDGSAFGEGALGAARALARRSGAVLHLLHVRDDLLPLAIDPERIQDDAIHHDLLGHPDRLAAAYLDALAAATRVEERVEVVTAVLEPPVADAIAAYARANDIDLVVLSTHGRGGFQRAWLGSVADATIRRVEQPVLLVLPGRRGVRPGPRLHIRRILVPLDTTPHSAAIVDDAAELAAVVGAGLVLLHVIRPRSALHAPMAIGRLHVDPADLAHRRLLAERFLDAVAESIRHPPADLDLAIVVAEDTVDTILKKAVELDASLIAMTTRGRAGLDRLLLGSVADKIVRSGAYPLLLVRPGSARRRPRPCEQTQPQPGTP